MSWAVDCCGLLAQAGDRGAGGLFGGPWGPLLPFLVIGTLFYLLLVRPEKRKRQEMERMLESLNKDDQVVTLGGIWGVVTNAAKGSEYVTIRVDEGNGTKLRVLRSSISRVLTDKSADKPKEPATS